MLLLSPLYQVSSACASLVQPFANDEQEGLIVRCDLQLCKQCFYTALEGEVHETIVKNKLFKPGERIAVAASGTSSISLSAVTAAQTHQESCRKPVGWSDERPNLVCQCLTVGAC